MGRTTRATRLQAPQNLANAQFLPQRPGHMDDPQRPSPLDVDGLAGGAHLWRDVEATLTHTTDAPGEAQQRLAIQGVDAAKVVDDVGDGVTSTIRWQIFRHILAVTSTSFLAVSHYAWRRFHP